MGSSNEPTPNGWLRPAFDNDFQALAFLVLVAALLVSPILLGHLHPEDREHAYQDMRSQDGGFSFAGHEIYEVQDDIDILFAGPSTVWTGIDSLIVEQALTQKLGRHARVVTYGSTGASIEVQYIQIRDTLKHKKVGMVVTSVPRSLHVDNPAWLFSDSPSPQGFRFLSYTDPPQTDGLPLRYRAMLYAGYVLRTPRDFLDWLRPPRKVPSPLMSTQGSFHAFAGYDNDPYAEYHAPVPQLPPDAFIYSPQTRNNFSFSGDSLPYFQTYYLHKLLELVKARHIKLVFVNIPEYEERGRTTVAERLCWPEILGPASTLIGLPPATLFERLSQGDIRKLYYNNLHLNRNGSEMFTRAITPVIVELYANPSRVN
jgi:hypothetical protein